jgi:dolichol kinase
VFAISVPLIFGWFWSLVVAVVTLLTWVTIESMRRNEPWFGKLFFTLSAPFVRHRERRTIVGNTWMALSATLLTVIFRDPVLIAGALVGWTFGDPAAEITGKLIPSKKYFDGQKSIAGTVGCFLISFAAYVAFFKIVGVGGAIIPGALTVALATTFAETMSLDFTVNDNFTIPLFSALALSYILI